MDKVICEKCGAEMQPIDPNLHCGMTCPQCGWGWATSPYDPLLEDETEYFVTLLAGNTKSKEVIKALSQLTGQNYLKAKKMIDDAPVNVFTGKAFQVKRFIEELDLASIQYEINPEFPN